MFQHVFCHQRDDPAIHRKDQRVSSKDKRKMQKEKGRVNQGRKVDSRIFRFQGRKVQNGRGD